MTKRKVGEYTSRTIILVPLVSFLAMLFCAVTGISEIKVFGAIALYAAAMLWASFTGRKGLYMVLAWTIGIAACVVSGVAGFVMSFLAMGALK